MAQTPLKNGLFQGTLDGTPSGGAINLSLVALTLGSPEMTNPFVTTIELGHESDTTLARVSAGVVSIEGVTVATATNTLTLSGKTLTAPKIASGGFIADANGNELIKFTTTASAVNEVTLANAATGNNPTFTASGGDTNIGQNITCKGTGTLDVTNGATTLAAVMNVLAPSMGAAQGVFVNVGVAKSNFNLASFGFIYASSGNSANYLALSLYGQAATCRFYYNRIYLEEGNGIELGTTTGSKIGTGASQKIGFWNATPIVQPTTSVSAATFVANTSGIANDTATFDGYTIGKVVKALRNAGLLA